jgi:2-dehydro-3-deoxygalactonokinase
MCIIDMGRSKSQWAHCRNIILCYYLFFRSLAISGGRIYIDWGTTNARAYRIGGDGSLVEKRELKLGILNVPPRGFRDAFETLTKDWREPGSAIPPVLMSGMIGSRQGWIEANYATCPAGVEQLAALSVPVPDVPAAWIVPGVKTSGTTGRNDVMRGEEVQILGALKLTGVDEAVICLPGTHSKWAKAEQAAISDFATAMTGEVFDLLCRHSILGKLMAPCAENNIEAFRHGVERAAQKGGLLNHLFAVRADGLFGDVAPESLGDYLSGILIGSEIAELSRLYPAIGDPVALVGNPLLTTRYETAMGMAGIRPLTVVAEQATLTGLDLVLSALGGNGWKPGGEIST